MNNGSTEAITYNALGQQVQVSWAGGAWNTLFDPSGLWMGRNTAGHWDVGGVFHLGRQQLGIYIDQFYGIHENVLGSSDSSTNAAGSETGQSLFYPWGQTWSLGSAAWNFSAFEYGSPPPILPPTLFRTYDPDIGRWMTPDLLGGDVTNPQSLNRYAYVGNNPTTLTDPLGLDGCDQSDDPAHCREVCWSQGDDYPSCPQETNWPGGGGGYPVGGGGGGGGRSPAQPAGQPLLGGAAAGEINPAVYMPGLIPIAPGVYITPTGEIISVWTVEQTSSAFAQWLAPAGAAATAFFSLKPQQDALNSGYYGCIGNEVFPFKGLLAAGGAQIFEHGALDAADRLAPKIAGAFYHFTDARFTAWGASSKVIVPRAVGGIRVGLEWAKVGGLALTDAELAHAIYTCRGTLQ